VKELTILVDLDAIVIDLIRPWLAFYNKDHHDDLTVDDLTTYKIHNHAKKLKQRKDLYRFFEDHINYLSCPVLPGASEGLLEMHRAGHDLIISTATSGSTASIKWELVKKAAPWLHVDNVMVGARKERLKGDVFIDDAPKNIVKYRNAWPEAHILTIAYPYNKSCLTLVNCYAQDHNHTVEAWQEMTEYVRLLSDGDIPLRK
jgi:5'(3')-deoxyribonucleotidase